ncbi:hypothetical protein [Rhizobium sp. IBUN]|uniref:hypothetical protein n=1 Tax=Rhizobium sp. IBUN TaxID=1042326 RepID=UPI0003F82532|nr:hypothetical protein [Rhizobium sp. IBUN]
MRLADIDQLFDETPGMRVVDELRTDESGVDPVGLRQLNLDLMDDAIPGINNVTRDCRPYTFMAWAAWKATQVAAAAGLDDPAVIADLVDRYEALYAWSHLIAGRPFRGAAALKRTIARRAKGEPFLFEGEEWEQYRKTRTSFMAPTEYGPSIKSMRYMSTDSMTIAEEVLPAIHDFDAAVGQLLPGFLFALAPPSVTDEDVTPFAAGLPVDQPSAAEMQVFRQMFYEIGSRADAGSARRRKASLDLVRGLLQRNGPCGADDLRRRFATRELADAEDGDIGQIGISATLLCLLQARQLQRLATEAMLLWLERLLSEKQVRNLFQPKPSEEIISRAHEAAQAGDNAYAAAATVGDFLLAVEIEGEAFGWPAAASEKSTDVVSLLSELIDAQRNDITRVPAIAARSFAIVRAVANAFAGQPMAEGLADAIDGRPDRLPMGLMSRRLEAIADRPLAFIWREIVESWVIGQHVHWSAVRGGDGKKRLRIGLEGDGWMKVRRGSSGVFEPTGDRLHTMLSLGVSCGLFARDGGGKYSSL